jgi:hypothetical protein
MSGAKLIWDVEAARGMCSVKPDHSIYDEPYFSKFTSWGERPVGKLLNEARVSLVNRHVGRSIVLDYGCGACSFVRMRGVEVTRGYDIMAYSTERLRGLDALVRKSDKISAFTFWDSFEHLENPAEVLSSRPRFVFMSIPIFAGPSDVISSKHWKPGEHYWYFTERGLVGYMADLGYDLIERSRIEECYTREGIGTFVSQQKLVS